LARSASRPSAARRQASFSTSSRLSLRNAKSRSPENPLSRQHPLSIGHAASCSACS
jgi:hypothetical protein